MQVCIERAQIYDHGIFRIGSALFGGGSVRFSFDESTPVPGGVRRIDGEGCVILPAFTDVHVHLREPGFSYKETVRSGSLAALASGYCAVCAMPNLAPVPDCRENLEREWEIIRRDAVTGVYPYGAITLGEKGEELADLESMESAVAFSDDGRGVQNPEMMRLAMLRAKAMGKLIAAHCEENSLLRGGYIHDGEYCRTHGHRGICSESEWRPIQRDLALAAETGCAYHVCHISAKESVALIRQAKKDGVNVTCETAPHYLTLNDSQLQEDGRFKMNPPIRSEQDRQALLEGLRDGTIDMIATDHAPHSAEEKSKGLAGSLMGITGLETAFPVLYTQLVKPGLLSLETLVEKMSIAPAGRFGIQRKDCFAVWDIRHPYRLEPGRFLSMGKATPFAGMEVLGKCRMTVLEGRIAWNEFDGQTEKVNL